MKDLFPGKTVRIHWIWTWKTMACDNKSASKKQREMCFLTSCIGKLISITSKGQSQTLACEVTFAEYCYHLISQRLVFYTPPIFHTAFFYVHPQRGRWKKRYCFACSWRNPLLLTSTPQPLAFAPGKLAWSCWSSLSFSHRTTQISSGSLHGRSSGWVTLMKVPLCPLLLTLSQVPSQSGTFASGFTISCAQATTLTMNRRGMKTSKHSQ